MMGVPQVWVLLAPLLLLADVTLPLLAPVKEAALESNRRPAGVPPPFHVRQKREWVWNHVHWPEEQDTPIPLKIHQLKSTQKVEVKHFKIEGEGANSIFTVDHNGDLYATKTLDREEKSEYHLTAMMYDGNNKLVEPAGAFIIQITDINDNRPVFPRTYNGSIVERCKIGSKVLEARATDADDPTTANGQLRYTLEKEGDQSAFTIDSKTGVISTKAQLDRETRSSYVVVVKAQDMNGKDTGSTATASVTITVTDTNDNMATFTKRTYDLEVPENQKLDLKVGILDLEDRDEVQNKQPEFTISPPYNDVFRVVPNAARNGDLILKKTLDYETKPSYSFSVHVRENNLQSPADNKDDVTKIKAQVNIRVIDVDEPPVFSKPIFSFKVLEETMVTNIGTVSAKDPDKANKSLRYSIEDKDCPISINPLTGQLSTIRKLDREMEATYMFQVKAQEEPSGLHSFVKVNILVQDINDNEPELAVDEVFVCENDMAGTVIGTVSATDKDDQPAKFSYYLAKPNANFSLTDNRDNTADIRVKLGTFSLDDPRDYILEVGINDGGQPPKSRVTPLPIKVCRCDARRVHTQCKAAALRMGVSVHALIAILLCILTILVIVILVVMRRRYQKENLALMKNSGDIHEQLVSYDEEGGGEMDTNGYDVSILTSARCHDGSMLCHDLPPPHHPALYAMVQKPHPSLLVPPPGGDNMAAMIETKKDEADRDRDSGVPYDTLHIYGYEGPPESLAGSLSSLDSSSSTASNQDYDFLQDWGPRFRTLAEMYRAEDHQEDEEDEEEDHEEDGRYSPY